MSKKTVLITCVVLLVGTLLTVGLLYQSDDSVADSYMAQYRKVTQDFQRTQVTTVKEFRDEDGNGTPGLGGGGTTPGINPNPGSGNPPTDNTGTTPTTEKDSSGAIKNLKYQGITTRGNLKYQIQSSQEPYWVNVKGSTEKGGSTFAGQGCWLFALMSAGYNKYGISASPGTQLEDYVNEYINSISGGSCSVDANGYLVAQLPEPSPSNPSGGVGQGQAFGEWLKNKLGVKYSNYNGATDKGWPTEPGEYIVYYKHPKNWHWMYVEVSKQNGKTHFDYGNSWSNSKSGSPYDQTLDMKYVFKLQ